MAHPRDPVCVVGAGPAGLATAAALRLRDVPFEVVDDGRTVGGIWDVGRAETPMYTSARFISSRTLSGFPGFPMPEVYPDYPRHDQVLAYLREFARRHELEPRITLGTRVLRASPDDATGGWEVERSDGVVRRYRALVVATGVNWHPHLPRVPGDFSGEQRHTFTYRDPEELRGRRVLVVGGGNSGCDIACDAARVADRALLSLRRGYHFIPKYVFGRPTDVFARSGPTLPAWIERPLLELLVGRILVGDLTRFGLPRPDHPILESHPILNTRVLHHLGHGDLEARPDVARLDGDEVVFIDGRRDRVDLVLWATGYERRFPFLPDDAAPGGPEDLYLLLFHRTRPNLAFPGLFETDGAAYGILGRQAGLVAGYLRDRMRGGEGAAVLDRRRRSADPDLRAGRRYLDSRRHLWYVKSDRYTRLLEREGRDGGWHPLSLDPGGGKALERRG